MPARKSPIRVLRVIARMNLGGPAHHVALLSRGLAGRGYETLLVSGRVGAGEAEHTDLEGIQVRYLDRLGPEIRPLRDLLALVELIRVVRAFRPEIVETHTAKAGMLGRLATLLAGGRRPVVIHTYHGHVLRGYFGPLKTGAFKAIERGLGRISDSLIGVSQATVDELVELRIAPRSKFAVVPLGLELEPFLALGLSPDGGFREEIAAGEEEVLFTFTGRLVPIKRPELMLRALARARAGGAPARVAVVGDGLLRAELESLARRLGCAGAVDFLGYRRDLAGIAAGSDAALLTSENEGTPVALIEAAAAGRPAVATAVGGVPDIVVEGAGLLAPSGDEAAIAAAITRLTAEPELRRRMGARARQHVAEKFTAARLLDDVELLYSRLLSKAAAAR
ncbi:MAG TPA: glycosyltransferase [Solirubrobacterales bacterium]|nr:glycosyltransferase [Solirubrobacterales bacterium]